MVLLPSVPVDDVVTVRLTGLNKLAFFGLILLLPLFVCRYLDMTAGCRLAGPFVLCVSQICASYILLFGSGTLQERESHCGRTNVLQTYLDMVPTMQSLFFGTSREHFTFLNLCGLSVIKFLHRHTVHWVSCSSQSFSS